MAARIGPSLMCCDLARVAEEISAMAADGADFLHIDVMDGHFVPNITLGVDFVRSLSAAVDLPQEVHLMVEHPGAFVETFADAGAAACCFHLEPMSETGAVIGMITGSGMKAGLALRPGTPLAEVGPFLPDIDQVLLMTVEPGFAGQKILDGSADRVATLADMIGAAGLAVEIKVDGGLTPEASRELVRAGGGAIVAGSSSVFADHRYVPGAVAALRRAIEE